MFELQEIGKEEKYGVDIEVFQTAFNSGCELEDFDTRVVRIESEIYNSCKSSNDLLNEVFLFGQNDFQPQETYSVSVGDLIRLPLKGDGMIDYKYYAVAPSGFIIIEQEKLQDFLDMNDFFRSIGSFTRML